VVTSGEDITADAPSPIAPVPRDRPAARAADRALLPCPGTNESDIAGYIGIAREERGERLWVSEPATPVQDGSTAPIPATTDALDP
jgi:hypothetical protein